MRTSTLSRLLPILFSLCLLPVSGGAPQFLTLRTLLISRDPAFELYFVGERAAEKVRVSAVQPSQPVKLRYANPLPIYDEPPNPRAMVPIRPIDRVELPANAVNILLLCLVSEEGNQYAAIVDDLPEASARDWRLINLTASPIAFQIGKNSDPVVVGANSRSRFRLSVDEPGGQAVSAVARIDGELRPIYSTYWPIPEDSRGIILFVQDGERIRLRRILDRIP